MSVSPAHATFDVQQEIVARLTEFEKALKNNDLDTARAVQRELYRFAAQVNYFQAEQSAVVTCTRNVKQDGELYNRDGNGDLGPSIRSLLRAMSQNVGNAQTLLEHSVVQQLKIIDAILNNPASSAGDPAMKGVFVSTEPGSSTVRIYISSETEFVEIHLPNDKELIEAIIPQLNPNARPGRYDPNNKVYLYDAILSRDLTPEKVAKIVADKLRARGDSAMAERIENDVKNRAQNLIDLEKKNSELVGKMLEQVIKDRDPAAALERVMKEALEKLGVPCTASTSFGYQIIEERKNAIRELLAQNQAAENSRSIVEQKIHSSESRYFTSSSQMSSQAFLQNIPNSHGSSAIGVVMRGYSHTVSESRPFENAFRRNSHASFPSYSQVAQEEVRAQRRQEEQGKSVSGWGYSSEVKNAASSPGKSFFDSSTDSSKKSGFYGEAQAPGQSSFRSEIIHKAPEAQSWGYASANNETKSANNFFASSEHGKTSNSSFYSENKVSSNTGFKTPDASGASVNAWGARSRSIFRNSESPRVVTVAKLPAVQRGHKAKINATSAQLREPQKTQSRLAAVSQRISQYVSKYLSKVGKYAEPSRIKSAIKILQEKVSKSVRNFVRAKNQIAGEQKTGIKSSLRVRALLQKSVERLQRISAKISGQSRFIRYKTLLQTKVLKAAERIRTALASRLAKLKAALFFKKKSTTKSESATRKSVLKSSKLERTQKIGKNAQKEINSKLTKGLSPRQLVRTLRLETRLLTKSLLRFARLQKNLTATLHYKKLVHQIRKLNVLIRNLSKPQDKAALIFALQTINRYLQMAKKRGRAIEIEEIELLGSYLEQVTEKVELRTDLALKKKRKAQAKNKERVKKLVPAASDASSPNKTLEVKHVFAQTNDLAPAWELTTGLSRVNEDSAEKATEDTGIN